MGQNWPKSGPKTLIFAFPRWFFGAATFTEIWGKGGGVNHSEPNCFVFLLCFRAFFPDSNELSYLA